MTHLLFYYLAGLALLFLALPLSLVFFPDRPDRGWAGARILGLVLTALLHRLAGPVQLEPWSLPALLLGLPVLVAWYTWVRRSHWKIRAWLVESRNSILGIELVFLCTFFIAALLSAYDPAVFGTERLMDMAVLQSISVAAAFPPLDPWFSGEALNYYWFGHHMALLPGALAGVPTSITYNLALAYIFAAVVQLSCGLLLPPAGSLQRALLGGAMVGFAGNLHAFVQLFTATSDTNLHFAASRIIPGTITEFPLLSLLVGDLHAHFALLPVILLFLLWLQVSPCDKRSMLAPIIVVNLLFFATAMGNPWNLAALLGLFGSLKILRCTVLPWWTLAPALALLPLVWPGRGLGITLAWVHPAQASPVPEFLQLWVVPLLLVTGLVDWTTVGTKLRKHRMLWIAAPLVLSFQSPVAGLCLALALLLWLAHRQGESLWAGMGIAALMLLIAPELVYLEDAYPAPFERMNTVFKFSYAAWPLLMLAAARAALLLLDTGPEGLQPLRRASLLLAIGVLFIYGARAVPLRLASN